MPEILVNVTLRKLYFYKDKARFSEYPVAVGKPSTPTPTGTWNITGKIVNPGGILGSRWMQLSIPAPDGVYGIHGTSQPSSIGKAVSLGCIRMYNHHIEEIFPLTPIGTKVEIVKALGEYSYKQDNKGQMGYTVKQGDTLWGIARRFGVNLETLIEANNIRNPDILEPGMHLIFPVKSG